MFLDYFMFTFYLCDILRILWQNHVFICIRLDTQSIIVTFCRMVHCFLPHMTIDTIVMVCNLKMPISQPRFWWDWVDFKALDPFVLSIPPTQFDDTLSSHIKSLIIKTMKYMWNTFHIIFISYYFPHFSVLKCSI